jgi:hypothetical protein
VPSHRASLLPLLLSLPLPHPSLVVLVDRPKRPLPVSRSPPDFLLPPSPPTSQQAPPSRRSTAAILGVAIILTPRYLSELTSGAPSGATVALDSTYTPGATPTDVSGAPPSPTGMLTIANYPALDQTPSVDSPEVQQWLSQIDLSGVPSYAPSTGDVGRPSMWTGYALMFSVRLILEPLPMADVGGLAVVAVCPLSPQCEMRTDL